MQMERNTAHAVPLSMGGVVHGAASEDLESAQTAGTRSSQHVKLRKLTVGLLLAPDVRHAGRSWRLWRPGSSWHLRPWGSWWLWSGVCLRTCQWTLWIYYEFPRHCNCD